MDNFIPFWNKKDLPSPEMISVQLEAVEPYQISTKISTDLANIVSNFEVNLPFLQKHNCYLKKMQDRMKNVFRNDIGFKNMKMLGKALTSCDDSFVKNIIAVQQCTYDDKGPTKQMIQWLLINNQRMSALFYRIYTLSIKTALYFKDRFYTGNHVNVAVIVMAIVSQIWSLSKKMLVLCSKWNSVFISFYTHLRFVGDKWLPEGEKIHKDLLSWLGCPQELTKIKTAIKDDVKKEKILQNNIEEDNIDSGVKPVSCLFFNEDIGESINEAEKKLETTQQFLDFIKSENQTRQFNRSRAKSKNISNKQWNKLSADVTQAVKLLGCLQESSPKFKNLFEITKKMISDVNEDHN